MPHSISSGPAGRPFSVFLGKGFPGVEVGQSRGQDLSLEHSPCPHSRCGPWGYSPRAQRPPVRPH